MSSRGVAWRTQSSGVAISVGLAASAALGGALGAGLPVLPILVALAAVLCAAALVANSLETLLLGLGATIFLPLPEVARAALILGTVAVVVGAALIGSIGRPQASAATSTAEVVVLAAAILMVLLLALSGAAHAQESLAPFIAAAALALAFLWALLARAAQTGPGPLAAGLAVASLASSVLVLLRLGGLPLIGSHGGAYGSAKNVVVSELGDVNGQALVVMLGLPFLLAVALQARGRLGAFLAALGVGLPALALVVLLSRSALVGAVVGAAVVVLAMFRMSRRRALTTVLVAAVLTVYFSQDLQDLTSDRTNLNLRSTLWSSAIDFWRESPIVGHGPDAWPRLVAEHARWAPEGGAGGTHNVLLSGLVAGGLLVAVLQISLVLVVLLTGIRGLKSLNRTPDRLLLVCLSGGLGAFVAQIVRGAFEATGWPGVRTYDFRTWGGLLLLAVVAVVLSASAAAIARDQPGREATLIADA